MTPSSRRHSRLRKLVFAGVVLGTLLALFYAWTDWHAARAWAACQRALAARGETLDFSALEGSSIPPTRNLALLPFFTHWGSYRIDAGTGRAVFLDANPTRFFDVLPWFTSAAIHADPGIADLDPAAWQHHFEHEHPPGEALDPAHGVLRAMEGFQPILASLSAARDAMPDGVFHREYGSGGVGFNSFGEKAELKLNLVLALRANALLGAGRPSEALHDIETALWLRQATCGDAPVLLPLMLGIALAHEPYFPIKNGLESGAWTADEIARLQGELSSIDLLADYEHAMRGERASFLETVDRSWPDPFRTSRGSAPSRDWRERWPLFVGAYGPRGWLDGNRTTLANWHQELLAACDPAAHRIYPERQRALFRRHETLSSYRPGNYLVRVAGYFLAPHLSVVADEQTRVDELVVRCALARYALAHDGHYPATLPELTPQFVAHVPANIKDGTPTTYKVTSDGHYQLGSPSTN